MTKYHIDIARGLKDWCENNSMSALQAINKTLVDDLTVQFWINFMAIEVLLLWFMLSLQRMFNGACISFIHKHLFGL